MAHFLGVIQAVAWDDENTVVLWWAGHFTISIKESVICFDEQLALCFHFNLDFENHIVLCEHSPPKKKYIFFLFIYFYLYIIYIYI